MAGQGDPEAVVSLLNQWTEGAAGEAARAELARMTAGGREEAA